MRIETGNTVSIRITRRWIFVVLSCYVKRSKSCHHNTMLEQFVFVARSSLAYPDMMCAISEREIFFEVRFRLQAFHTCTKFFFIRWKENRVHDSEIKLRRFIAIETKAVFNSYFHTVLVWLGWFGCIGYYRYSGLVVNFHCRTTAIFFG